MHVHLKIFPSIKRANVGMKDASRQARLGSSRLISNLPSVQEKETWTYHVISVHVYIFQEKIIIVFNNV